MKNYQLGEFEEIVMLAVGILHGDAYGVTIKKEIEKRTSRNVSIGALHTALKRLENKKYLRSFPGEGDQERAGRPKKFFEITALGQNALSDARQVRESMWNAMPDIKLNPPLIQGT